MPKKILIIEDEEKIVEVVKAYLEKEGYKVSSETTGKNGFNRYMKEKPDLVILDLMLPDITGEEICKKIRAESDIPILMLTAKARETDKIEGFSIGADDYITKPFRPKELLARVRAVLRRSNIKTDALADKLEFEGLSVDAARRRVIKGGAEINLTATEYNILLALARHSGQVYSRDKLIEKIRSQDFEGFDRTIDTHIKNLRKKIENNPDSPRFIKTIYGAGYKFDGGIKR